MFTDLLKSGHKEIIRNEISEKKNKENIAILIEKGTSHEISPIFILPQQIQNSINSLQLVFLDREAGVITWLLHLSPCAWSDGQDQYESQDDSQHRCTEVIHHSAPTEGPSHFGIEGPKSCHEAEYEERKDEHFKHAQKELSRERYQLYGHSVRVGLVHGYTHNNTHYHGEDGEKEEEVLSAPFPHTLQPPNGTLVQDPICRGRDEWLVLRVTLRG